MSLRFEVLGFAGAAPLEGACSSYVVSGADRTVLLDCGPGTLERLWRRQLLERLDAIVISHMHADHVLDLLPFAGEVVRSLLAGRCIALHVPRDGGAGVLGALDRVFARERTRITRFDAAFEVHEYGRDDRLKVGDLELTFAATAHPQPCFAIRVTDGRAVVVYGADGGPSESVQRLAAGADLLVLEATFATDADEAAVHGHMTAVQAGEVAARAGVARLLLTHLIPDPGSDLASHAAESFSGPIDIAREGLTYNHP